MTRILMLLFISVYLFACTNKTAAPDVSGVKVNVTLQRFDKDFFEMDTTNMNESLQKLQQKYPLFFKDYMLNILGVDDEMLQNNTATKNIQYFITSYKPLYDSSTKAFGNFNNQFADIKQMLQYVKYYFTTYQLPLTITTFIGPIDAAFKTSFGIQSDIITAHTLGVGLQLHLGNSFSYYNTQQGLALYPAYISNRFEQDNIAINLAKNIVDDVYPITESDKPLIQQMIEKGKRLYILNSFVPKAVENKLIGYTDEQMKACYTKEQAIWDLFVKNGYLQITDKNIIKNYLDESPKTQELGEGAPGNIGAFVGWQIVKKYMQKNAATTLQQLINMDNDIIFQQTKYKP
jgi:hypothetical protein